MDVIPRGARANQTGTQLLFWPDSLTVISRIISNHRLLVLTILLQVNNFQKVSGVFSKQKRFKKIAWIWSHRLHLQWKFKLWAGKFTWGNKAKHYRGMSTTFLFSKVCWRCPAMFCLYTSRNFPAHNLNFLWKWRWWDQIQATFKIFSTLKCYGGVFLRDEI